jgi:hypothetical protein
VIDAQFEEAPLRPAADQELFEFRGAVSVHATIAMTCAQVALVQCEVLAAALRRQHPRLDVGIARKTSALAAIGHEIRDGDAHRDAGAATAAVRAVDEVARAAKAPGQRARIDFEQARIVRIEHQIARIALRPVTAGVLAGVEQTQAVDLAHGSVLPVRRPQPRRREQRHRRQRRMAVDRQDAGGGMLHAPSILRCIASAANCVIHCVRRGSAEAWTGSNSPVA